MRSIGPSSSAKSASGEDHLYIQTQYCLRTFDGAAIYLMRCNVLLLQGAHAWQNEPESEDELDGWYVAGLDVGGEARVDPERLSHLVANQARGGRTRHDSTVLTIARVSYNELSLPCLEVVHQVSWTGLAHVDQYAALRALVEHWNIRTLVIDSTAWAKGWPLCDFCSWFRMCPPNMLYPPSKSASGLSASRPHQHTLAYVCWLVVVLLFGS